MIKSKGSVSVVLQNLAQQIYFMNTARKRLIKSAEESKRAVAQRAPKASLGGSLKVLETPQRAPLCACIHVPSLSNTN